MQTQSLNNKTLMIAGGGTGGHIWAGVSVAQAWSGKIIFVGARGGLEEKLVPQSGYPLELIHIGSLNRVSVFQKIKTVLLLPFALIKSAFLVIKHKPDAVLGVGGYAAGPVLLASSVLAPFLKIKTGILEQNSVFGLTNGILSRLVQNVFLNFEISTLSKGIQKKIHVVGNPIRSNMKKLPLPDQQKFCIFIFGGSQGAVGINTAVMRAIELLGEQAQKVQWIHQTGQKDFERVKNFYASQGLEARIEPFIYDMEGAYRVASLVICRAGASSLAELSAVGRPAILVPLPTAADDHQRLNAQVFSASGAAFLVEQNENAAAEVTRIIHELIQKPDQIHQIAEKMHRHYRSDSALKIVEVLA